MGLKRPKTEVRAKESDLYVFTENDQTATLWKVLPNGKPGPVVFTGPHGAAVRYAVENDLTLSRHPDHRIT